MGASQGDGFKVDRYGVPAYHGRTVNGAFDLQPDISETVRTVTHKRTDSAIDSRLCANGGKRDHRSGVLNRAAEVFDGCH